jgi:hypothetical protein
VCNKLHTLPGYNSKLPLNVVDRWLFDISYWTTDIILGTGAFDRHIFYCPSWRQRDNIIFWRYGENFPAGTPENHPQDEATRRNYSFSRKICDKQLGRVR